MRHSLKHKEESILEKFQEATSNLVEDVERLGKITREAASESVDQAQKNISELYQKGQEKVIEAEHQVEGYIQRHPMRAVFLMFGAGFLMGWLRKNR